MLTNAQAEPIIPVSDVDEAVSFYGGKLGLEILERVDADPANPELRFGVGSTTLTVYESSGAGQSRHTLANFVVDDVRATVVALRERGVKFEEYDLPGYKTEDGIAQIGAGSAAWFKDSDGNILAVGSYG